MVCGEVKMLEEMPKVYEGDRPYVVVSYARDDKTARTIIGALDGAGYCVWYDDGILMGSSFPDYKGGGVHKLVASLFDCQ